MIKYKRNLFICLILSNIFFCIGQQPVSIYEIGEPITSCDVNIKNLLRNWVPEKIVNAGEYEFLEWLFVETIDDSSRYVYYRNYFSGSEPVYVSREHKSGYNNENKYDSLWIRPGFIHREFYDTRGLPDKAREILSEDVRLNAKDILSKDLGIDTIKLLFHSYHKTDSTERFETTGAYSKEARSFSSNIATIDSLSQNYIDVFFTRKKSYSDLSIEETRELLLEELLINRISQQINFDAMVDIGDKVFVIKFKHQDELYNNFIICNSKTNKVVMDYFFLQVTFQQQEE